MSSSGWWNVLLSATVAGLWLAAACSNGASLEETPVPDEHIIDDDDYSSPPLLECSEEVSRGEQCRLTGSIEASSPVNYKNTPLRLAFYSSDALGEDGLPVSPDRYTEVTSLAPPFTFPLSFEVPVTSGRVLIAEAWIDGNADGTWSAPDFLGYSEPFAPEAGDSIPILIEPIPTP